MSYAVNGVVVCTQVARMKYVTVYGNQALVLASAVNDTHVIGARTRQDADANYRVV